VLPFCSWDNSEGARAVMRPRGGTAAGIAGGRRGTAADIAGRRRATAANIAGGRRATAAGIVEAGVDIGRYTEPGCCLHALDLYSLSVAQLVRQILGSFEHHRQLVLHLFSVLYALLVAFRLVTSPRTAFFVATTTACASDGQGGLACQRSLYLLR